METISEKTQPVINNAEECCPPFDAAQWNNAEHHWHKKLFLKDAVPEVFHWPLPGTYAKAITRMWKKAEDAGAAPERTDFLLLAHDPSPFKGELYMAITKEIPGEEIARLSGTFVSKVFDGPYGKIPGYLREMNGYLASKKKKANKIYFYFPYCPKCAKKYGHNYIVALAELRVEHAPAVL